MVVTDSDIAGDYSRLTYSPTAASGGERFLPQRQTHAQQGFWQAPASGITATAQEHSAQGISASIPQQRPKHQSQHNMPPSRRKRDQNDENDDSGDVEYASGSANAGTAGAKTSRKRKSTSGQGYAVGRAPGDVGPSLGIDIKTKFPVARIKRIMQADEDVGKVAQATPTAVCELTTILIETSCFLLILLTSLFLSSQSTRVVHDRSRDQSSGGGQRSIQQAGDGGASQTGCDQRSDV